MDNNLLQLAALINGEAADQPYDVKLMVGSTVINRLNAGKAKEFGASLPDVALKGYYAAQNPNEPYKQALTQQFPDKISEDAFKQSLAIASALIKGTVKPQAGQFYFTEDEEGKLRKNKKAFNFKAVKSVGKVGKYNVYEY